MTTLAPNAWGDLWPTLVGPNVLAWSYRDDALTCHTVYTVYVIRGGRPRLQFAFVDQTFADTTIDDPERFGTWDTPREFAQWARRWKDNAPVSP